MLMVKSKASELYSVQKTHDQNKTNGFPYLFQVPMICNPPVSLECRYKNDDNTSSEQEMEEIILGDLSPTTGDISRRDTTPEAETLTISNEGNGSATKTNDITLKKTNGVTPNNTNNVTPNKPTDGTPNKTNNATQNKTNYVTPNNTNNFTPNKTNDVTPNKNNDTTPNKMKVNGGADPVVNAPSNDRVPNSVEFNLSDDVTQKPNNCNGHSKSTKITM